MCRVDLLSITMMSVFSLVSHIIRRSGTKRLTGCTYKARRADASSAVNNPSLTGIHRFHLPGSTPGSYSAPMFRLGWSSSTAAQRIRRASAGFSSASPRANLNSADWFGVEIVGGCAGSGVRYVENVSGWLLELSH